MTRGNSRGDIGFLKASERLNVLLSRARNCLIMIGNSDTFMASKNGKHIWPAFFQSLKAKGYLHGGLPVQCSQHPTARTLLSAPEDFEQHCPDGGCSQPCGEMLACRLHKCPRKCHRTFNHSEISCKELVEKICEKQHEYKVRCSRSSDGCLECHEEEEALRRRTRMNLELEKKRKRMQAEYKAKLESVQDELASLKRTRKLQEEEESQKKKLKRLNEELENLKQTTKREEAIKEDRKQAIFSSSHNQPPTSKITTKAVDPASAQGEWELQKKDEKASNPVLDELMSMIGLEKVKYDFLNIKSSVDTALRQGVSTREARYGCSLLGNPGTGKTTVARLYAKFLTSITVIAGSEFEETSGAKLSNIGVAGTQKMIDDLIEKGGGVIFIDEAYQLSSGNSPGGKAVLDYLLTEIENQRGKIVFLLAGYTKQMETFFAHNPGLPSRFPIEMKFADYTDQELLEIFILKINGKYAFRMKAEDGLNGLYCRIVSRRIGRGRGKEGFGNARAVENQLQMITRRQAKRLFQERRAKKNTDDFLFTKTDLIGPDPSAALHNSQAWTKLRKLIGLKEVKDSVQALVDTLQTNYQRELEEKSIVEFSLNKIFLGNPGTGKTTVAKLYGEILVDLNMLSNGEVVIKNPSDFIGAVIGASEQNTKGILAASIGKVLVIDEAYGLYEPSNSAGGFKTAVVDTIVAEVQSVPGDDRCVLLLGYKDQMEEMFQNVNPGLSRRFPISSGFVFEDFTEAELSHIIDLKLGQHQYSITTRARQVMLDMLSRARNRPNFGNAGEVDILLDAAKLRHQKRLTAKEATAVATFEPKDFDENFDRLETSQHSITELFSDTVGCDAIISVLQGYQDSARSMKALGLDPKQNIAFNFLFRGPPGTGKSTTARKMGRVFYDMGFLASDEVVDASASDLVGQYVGQTGPKVLQLLDKALGRVLLIDEAYRLAEGHFAKEALDEIVDAVTKERYHKKLIIILAGYEHDINKLLQTNPGLTSRFPQSLNFNSLDSHACVALVRKKLQNLKDDVEEKKKGTMDISCLTSPSPSFISKLKDLFDTLSHQDAWANARDLGTISANIFQAVLSSLPRTMADGRPKPPSMLLTEKVMTQELDKMIQERGSRSCVDPFAEIRNSLISNKDLPIPQLLQTQPLSSANTFSNSNTEKATAMTPVSVERIDDPTANEIEICNDDADEDYEAEAPTFDGFRRGKRDAGVSDEVWDQLQEDIRAEQAREQEYQAKLKAKREAIDDATRETNRERARRGRREKKTGSRSEKETGNCCLLPSGVLLDQTAGRI